MLSFFYIVELHANLKQIKVNFSALHSLKYHKIAFLLLFYCMSTSTHQDFIRGLKVSIPMLVGIIPFALVLGTQATQKGFNLIELPLLTGLNFAGGSEFAILEMWSNPPQFLMLIFITFLVNSRHLLMGASLVPHLKHLPNKKAYTALFFMCDES